MTNSTVVSPAYSVRVSLQDVVLGRWVKAVRAHVHRAQSLPTPVLINTLPMFYKHLAALVSNDQAAYDHSTLGLEHGGERARMTAIDVQGITHEFHLLRSVLFQVWTDAGIVIDAKELALINAAIDEALRDSIAGFVARETTYREEFFSALTHDLRTPLGTAGMAIDLIGKTASIERAQSLAGIVRKQHSLMERMITDLLEMMSLRAGQEQLLDMTEVDLMALTEDVVRSAELTSKKLIQLSGHDVIGHWSSQSMRRAIENLVGNAIKYGDPGTAVTVTIEQIKGRVALTVTNFGAPIPADQIESLFQIFRRGGREAHTGGLSWGVGLSYVRSVAERHAGSIVVASNADQTSFVLDVPIDPRPLLLTRER